MAKIIDDETMENVCILAFPRKKKGKAKAEMQKMLDYVEKLDELDTSEVEPMSHIFQDETYFVRRCHKRRQQRSNAGKCTEGKEGQYQVPKTIG